ncbi:MAG: hypothetical protein LQ348_004235 [Seirophora lacunosa]|nr:MAG: hypothetical protein LQ348_004235 [Seirophora lacunosa]
MIQATIWSETVQQFMIATNGLILHCHGKSPGSRQDLSLARQVRQLEFGQNKVGRDGHCRYGHCYGVDDQQKNICDSSSQFPLTGAHRQPQNCLRSSPLPYTLDQKEEHAARQVELETERSTSDHGYLGASPPTRVRHGLPDPNHRNREFDTEGYAPSGGLPNSINKQQSSWSPQYSGVENTDYSMSYGELPPQMTRQTGVPNPVAKGQMQASKERFLTSPSPLENLGWDNPFPTFPSSKKRHKGQGIEDLNNKMDDVKLEQRLHARMPEESVLSNGGGNLRHDLLRNVGSSTFLKGAPAKTIPKTAHSPFELQQDKIRGAGDSPQIIRSQPNPPIPPPSRLGPQLEYNRQPEDTPWDQPFRQPAPRQTNNQRSQTMPAALTDGSASPSSRGNHEQRSTALGGRQTPLAHRDWAHLESPLHHQSPRPSLQPYSRSTDALPQRGRMNHGPQTLHVHSLYSQQRSMGEVSDPFHHRSHHSNSSFGYADLQRAFPEEAMPNFESLAGAGASHTRGMTIDDHLCSPQAVPALPSIPVDLQPDTPNWPEWSSRLAPGFCRSGSSPSLQGSQGLQQYGEGFDFELPGSTPAKYASSLQSRDDVYPSNMHRRKAFQPGYSEQQQSPKPAQTIVRQQGLNRTPGTGGLDGKVPQSRSLPPQSRSPVSKAFPPPHDSSGRSRTELNSMNRMEPGPLPTGQLSHPDALPAHPVPIRPARRNESTASPQPQISRAPRGESQPSAVTHEGLERLRQASKSNHSDRKTQLILAKKLVEAASVLADEGGSADPKTTSRNCERFSSEAYKIVKKLAQNGYPDAMFFLGDCYSRGSLGLQTDAKEAFAQYQSAAKAEHAQAAYRVAVCCEIGLDEGGGTKRDAVKAMQWYQRAATLGDTPAMYKLGVIQLKGLLGQPRNASAALTWLQQAAARADKENPHALHELALLYEAPGSIEGIRQDEARSKQHFFEAADLGYKFSQFRLGCAFEYGLLGCPIDPRQSIAWYSKAAVQDEHQSELALSGWYLTGSEGVLQQSDTEAYLWARKAAQAGLAKAEYAMGYFIEVGIGAPANMEDAKRWYWRSASQNFPKARERLEDLRRGGAKMQKTRVSRSKMNKPTEGECSVM